MNFLTARKEELKKLMPPLIIIVVMFIFLIIWGIPFMNNFVSSKIGEPNECSISPYNHYSNSTYGAFKSVFGDRCYIEVDDYYETKERCGLFGISCYESSESHYERYSYQVCFHLKTGELC